MNFGKRKAASVDLLAVICLFCAFLVAASFTVLFGARIYSSQNVSMEKNVNDRIAASYIPGKIHSAGAGAEISLYSDGKGIEIKEIRGQDREIVTHIYFYDGKLREQTLAEGVNPVPENGTVIMEVSDFTIEEAENGLVKYSVTETDGSVESFRVYKGGAR